MRKKLCMIFGLVGAVLAQPRPVAAAPDALVVFGDSFSDTGLVSRTLVRTTGQNLPYSPPYFEGRFSNGPVAVEHMANRLGVSLDSRAWGGAMTGEGNILGPLTGLGQSGMASQVRNYVAEQGGRALSPGTLHVIWAGANDLIFRPEDATAQLASAHVVQAIDALYAAGARSFFVPSMPDLSLSPLLASDPADGDNLYRLASLAFNDRLAQDLAAASLRYADAHIVQFDTVGFLREWIAGPQGAGLDAVNACVDGTFAKVRSVCADPDQHVYWDGTHFSARVHAGLGEAFATAVPEPASLALMGCGLGGLLWLRPRRALPCRRSHHAHRPQR